MKKIICTISLLFTIGIAVVSAQCGCSGGCSPKISKTNLSTNQDISAVKVYYVHSTRRCATCMAVEAVSEKAIQKFYGDKVPFKSINREESKNKALLKRYNIKGQGLFILNVNEKVNLTNIAFLNARNNPKKLEEKIKSTIDSIL